MSNLLIGVKAVKLLFWEAKVHTLVRTDWACPFILVYSLVPPCLGMLDIYANVILCGIVQRCVSGANCGTI